MTVIAVLAKPPREGLVLPELAETTPLSEAAVAEFYEAMLRDTFLAADRSGGELLVNYLPEDEFDEAYHTDIDPVAELRSIAADTLDDVSEVRFEPQVGSSVSSRAGNTLTHLLDNEEVASAAVVFGTAPLLSRLQVDSAAMKLRTNEVVLGPAADGRVYYAGFTEPVDFTESFEGIELQRLTNRAGDADLDTEFIPRPRVHRVIRPRARAGRGSRRRRPGARRRRRVGPPYSGMAGGRWPSRRAAVLYWLTKQGRRVVSGYG